MEVFLGDDLRESAVARPELLGLEQCHPGAEGTGAVRDLDRGPVGKAAGTFGYLEANIDPVAGHRKVRRRQPGATGDIVAAHAGNVDGDALAGAGAFDRPVAGMQAAYPYGLAVRHQPERIPDGDRAGMRRTRCDQAGAVEGEHPVDGEAEGEVVVSGFPVTRHQRQHVGEIVDIVAGDRRYRQAGGAGKRRRCEHVQDLGFHLGKPLAVDDVRLGDGDQPAMDAEQIENLQMLPGLRHRPVIGGDHQQHRIDAGDASQHVADEAFMARHVDEGEVVTVATTMGIAEIDGHAATFLLRQPVGIDAGQGA